MEKKPSKIWFGVAVFLITNLVVWSDLAKDRQNDFVRMEFFDVGQGDGIYIRTPQGNDIVVDGGPGDVMLSKLGQALPFYDRTIELIILTHPHADHVSGLVEVLKRYEVSQVVLPEAVYDSEVYKEFLDLLKQKHISVAQPRLGQRIFLDEQTVFDVLYPVLPRFAKLPSDINDVSIVGRLSFGGQHVLFTGDAGQDIEQLLLALKLPLDATILKIGHHGSRHSSALEFISAVSPAYSVISVGADNRYGHPHPEVLAALKKVGIGILRTDQEGDVVFEIHPDRVLRGN